VSIREHLAQVGVPGAGRRPVGLPNPLERCRQRLGGAEVVRQRVEEPLAQRRGPLRGRPGDQAPPGFLEPPHLRLGLLHPLVVELDRLAVVGADEVHDQRIAPIGVERLVEQEDVAHRLRHLRVVEADHAVVHPQPRERDSVGGERLGQLVLVVGEDQIGPPAVDLEADAEQLLGHR
jgi:hypothetical protein